jgi:hypothetical protein
LPFSFIAKELSNRDTQVGGAKFRLDGDGFEQRMNGGRPCGLELSRSVSTIHGAGLTSMV